MSASASDIITYIGVPLAVLGVLPILYTFFLALLTQRRIRRALVRYGHRPLTVNNQHDGFSIRSSPMTSLIEVELPKYTIAPLDRHAKEYWKLSRDVDDKDREHDKLLDRTESTLSMVEEGRVHGFLRGGSWRAFNWRRLAVGKKLYRIQYEDELCEPPAEIDLSDLLHYLLDWGAEPDSTGWEKLRGSGLWTPAGTVLLRYSPWAKDANGRDRSDWVLRTSVPDESDGILTLCVRWPSEHHDIESQRGAASLPPGWGRLYRPEQLTKKTKVETDRRDLPQRIEEYQAGSLHKLDNRSSESFRFRADNGVVSRILWESSHIETGFGSDLFHLSDHDMGYDWFTCVAAALISTRDDISGGLWGHKANTELLAFARRDTVPCGVLVLLGLIPEDSAPHWTEPDNLDSEVNQKSRLMMQRMQAKIAAEKLEASMPPEQARVHRTNRQNAELRQMMDDSIASQTARRERDERRTRDAMASARMQNKAVAQGCLAWLIDQGEVGKDWDVRRVTEAVLFLLAVDEREDGEASKVMKILSEWTSWAMAGGMKQSQLTLLQDNKVEFCFATCLVAALLDGSTDTSGQVGVDMLDCLKSWPKVRLG